jgi:hypothetical protein
MKTIKILILSGFIVFFAPMNIKALEEVKSTTDHEEVLEEIEKTAEDDLKKVTGKIGKVELRKGALTLEELEPLAPLDPQTPIAPQAPAINNFWEERAVSSPVNQMKVFIDRETKITDGKNRLSLDDLNEKMKVKVIYKTSWLGKNVAHSIIVK